MNELEIRIRTVLEGSGIKLTDDQLKSLAGTTQRAGTAAKDASGSIEQFGRRGSEAKDAFEGLTRVAAGGEGAIFGLAKAWRALTVAFAANPVTATLALVLGLLPLIKKGFDLIADSAEKSTKAMAGTGEATKAAAVGMKELADASEKYVKKATADAEALTTAMNNAGAAIDGALRRFKEVEKARLGAEQAKLELDRQSALATATSDEQKAAINAEFDARSGQAIVKSARSVDDKELLATAQRGIAADADRDNAAAAIGGAAARTAAARKAEEAARSSGNASAFGTALRAREAAERDEAAVRKSFQPLLDKAINTQNDVDADLKAFGFKEQQGRSERATTSLQTSFSTARQTNPSLNRRQAELRHTAEEAQARGDFASQDAAVAELRRLNSSAGKLAKAVVETGATTSAALDAATRELDKQKRKAKLAAQAGPGGGG